MHMDTLQSCKVTELTTDEHYMVVRVVEILINRFKKALQISKGVN